VPVPWAFQPAKFQKIPSAVRVILSIKIETGGLMDGGHLDDRIYEEELMRHLQAMEKG
jgi:hypothetical protein